MQRRFLGEVIKSLRDLVSVFGHLKVVCSTRNPAAKCISDEKKACARGSNGDEGFEHILCAERGGP